MLISGSRKIIAAALLMGAMVGVALSSAGLAAAGGGLSAPVPTMPEVTCGMTAPGSPVLTGEACDWHEDGDGISITTDGHGNVLAENGQVIGTIAEDQSVAPTGPAPTLTTPTR